MPGIGATDSASADLVVQAWADMGLSRQLQQTRRVLPHPREGGSSGYPVWFREEQLEKWYAERQPTSLWHLSIAGKIVFFPAAKQARLHPRQSWGLT
jgi:hypothetical protein